MLSILYLSRTFRRQLYKVSFSTRKIKKLNIFVGSAVGLTITYPIFGLLISLYGWDSVFYFTGIATSIWTLLWWILIYDTPNKHPTISEAEKVYLNETVTVPSMIHNVKDSKLKTPWRSILSSKPFWAVLIASQGVIWGSVTMQMQLPSYFHQVYELDVKQVNIWKQSNASTHYKLRL